MGTYSEAIFYRPGNLQTIEVSRLKKLLSQIVESGISDSTQKITYTADFGPKIDVIKSSDDLDDSWNSIAYAGVSKPKRIISFKERLKAGIGILKQGYGGVTVKDYTLPTHDINVSGTPEILEEHLNSTTHPISRSASYGTCSERTINDLSLKESPENNRVFRSFYWSIRVSPVLISGIDWDSEYLTGWLSFSLDGPGYFYPETFSEWLTRCKDYPALQQIQAACESLFPVASAAPSQTVKTLRTTQRDFEPGVDQDAPVSWTWGLGESG